MTEEQAIGFATEELWKPLSYRQRAELQFTEDRLCMPFAVFHEALEKALDRPVWTHELGLNREGIRAELFQGKPPPTLDEIMGLIPPEKRLIVVV